MDMRMPKRNTKRVDVDEMAETSATGAKSEAKRMPNPPPRLMSSFALFIDTIAPGERRKRLRNCLNTPRHREDA